MSAVDDYLAGMSAPQKDALERIRTIIKQTAPEAEEVLSYGMPGFKYKGKYLIGFAAFKDHMSVFPTSGPVEALKEQLRAFTISKGTVQFTLDNPIPSALLQAMVLHRLSTISQA